VPAGGANAQTNVSIQEILSACADGLLLVDTDRDGWVTPAEAEAAMEANFSLLDGDGDSAVTQDEFAACRTGSMTETRRSATLYASNVFFIADEDDDDVLDRDTVVTLEEYSAAGRLRHDQAAEDALSDPEVGVPFDALADGR